MIGFRWILLRMRNISDKICIEYQNTRFVFSNPSFPENRAVYETVWENIVERGRLQMAIRRMRIACWIRKAKQTHTQVVWYSLLFQRKNGCTNAPQCVVILYLFCSNSFPIDDTVMVELKLSLLWAKPSAKWVMRWKKWVGVTITSEHRSVTIKRPVSE
jgi:hypothetical protein